ncbi:MAG TPA: phosphatidate cytidylyltransferase [Myxococcota bacterium]|nr:phosphatidate cytidylyltransferase [Myxococcota bacterium]
MKNLAIRIGTAAVLIPLVLLLIWMAPFWAWALLMLAAAGMATWELADFTQPQGHLRERVVIVAASVAVCATVCFAPAFALAAVALGTIALATVFLLAFRDIETVAHRLALGLSATLLVGLPVGLMGLVRTLPNGPAWVTLGLMATWLGDTGGYFFGKYLGRDGAKLYPAVSPNKTWMGAFGALVGAIGAAALASAWYMRGAAHPLVVAAVALPLAPAGVVGDLVESMCKRTFGVKDSGTLLPGHGGLLDRIDAVLFTAPVLYYLAAALAPWLQAHLR